MTVVGKDERGMMERKGQMEEGRIEKKRKENQNKQWDDAFSILWEAYAANPTHTPTHPYAHTVTHTHTHTYAETCDEWITNAYMHTYICIYIKIQFSPFVHQQPLPPVVLCSDHHHLYYRCTSLHTRTEAETCHSYLTCHNKQNLSLGFRIFCSSSAICPFPCHSNHNYFIQSTNSDRCVPF